MKATQVKEGLTFDDVLLQPGESQTLPMEVDLKTRLTRRIELNIPLISAAMDTVTESGAAIAMARAGGLGIIHRNLSIAEQALEVARVKKSESGMVLDPITLSPDQKLERAVQLKRENNISGFPITKNGKLVGILTNRDIRFEKNLSRKISEFMTKKVITVGEKISLEEAKKILHKHRIEKLPVVDRHNNLKGLITIKDIEKAVQFPNACKDSFGRFRVGAAIGTGDVALERAARLIEAGVDLIVIDTAHGHSKLVLETVKKFRKQFSEQDLIVGNIATEEAAATLIRLGVDGIKVGVGPGSICTTRIVSGVGVPQVTAIMNCAAAIKNSGVVLVADGGIKFSGDLTKAIAAGADVVMIGSLFAGTNEAPGEMILYQGRSYKIYRGMGSLGAMKQGSRDRYFQGAVEETSKLVPEGIEGMVPSRGPLADTIHQLVGGLRSGMGYVGSKNIKELKTKGHFVKISAAGLKESHVHDVMITKEAPNYRIEK